MRLKQRALEFTEQREFLVLRTVTQFSFTGKLLVFFLFLRRVKATININKMIKEFV